MKIESKFSFFALALGVIKVRYQREKFISFHAKEKTSQFWSQASKSFLLQNNSSYFMESKITTNFEAKRSKKSTKTELQRPATCRRKPISGVWKLLNLNLEYSWSKTQTKPNNSGGIRSQPKTKRRLYERTQESYHSGLDKTKENRTISFRF